jgi:hypothetical protein
LKQFSEERDEQINSTKNQIDEFLQVIEQYEEEAQQDQSKYNEMQRKIYELE